MNVTAERVEEIEAWKAEAREAAAEDFRKNGPHGGRVFTDGLGALGVGTSMTDMNSRGNVMHREYHACLRELVNNAIGSYCGVCGEAIGEGVMVDLVRSASDEDWEFIHAVC